jgi:hypothetical protein
MKHVFKPGPYGGGGLTRPLRTLDPKYRIHTQGEGCKKDKQLKKCYPMTPKVVESNLCTTATLGT